MNHEDVGSGWDVIFIDVIWVGSAEFGYRGQCVRYGKICGGKKSLRFTYLKLREVVVLSCWDVSGWRSCGVGLESKDLFARTSLSSREKPTRPFPVKRLSLRCATVKLRSFANNSGSGEFWRTFKSTSVDKASNNME